MNSKPPTENQLRWLDALAQCQPGKGIPLTRLSSRSDRSIAATLVRRGWAARAGFGPVSVVTITAAGRDALGEASDA